MKVEEYSEVITSMKGQKGSTHLTLGPEPTTSNVQIGNKINQDLQSKTGQSKIDNALTSQKVLLNLIIFLFKFKNIS